MALPILGENGSWHLVGGPLVTRQRPHANWQLDGSSNALLQAGVGGVPSPV